MKRFSLTSYTLHLLAMALMLCDHMWATIVPGNQWMTAVGRLAFPIFAFLLAEGFVHTRSVKRYALRMFLFALLSEIPFNLMIAGGVIFPFHQNVLWTFLISIGCMAALEKCEEIGAAWARIPAKLLTVLAGTLAGFLLMVDYFGFGVLMVLTFYFLRGRNWYHRLGQFAALFLINCVWMGGLQYSLVFGGWEYEIPQQGLAVLALIPIWLYGGEQGHRSRYTGWFFYAFYPLHMLVLGLMQHFA